MENEEVKTVSEEEVKAPGEQTQQTPEPDKKVKKKKSPVKIVLISVLCVILAALLLFGGYFAYVFISFHRLGDMEIEAQGSAAGAAAETGKTYTITSYNVGFGAYEDDYGFFMDGGKEAWAWSKERLDANLKKIAGVLKDRDADFYLVQEVDIDSTRTYHFDERPYLTDVLTNKSYTFAQNYDSPFLFYPILQPHGASKSGIMTFSSFTIRSAMRYELPIETGLSKLLDLDRCYSKNYVDVEGGKQLALYCFHLSAYTTDPSTATNQLKLLLGDMEQEYKKGNYCIAGGDFNKDILGDSSKYFGKSDVEYNWAKAIPEELLAEYSCKIVAPIDENDPVPTCRNADGPYHEGQYVVTIDGFIVSPNITVKSSIVIDTQFKYSDHNPVEMTFELN